MKDNLIVSAAVLGLVAILALGTGCAEKPSQPADDAPRAQPVSPAAKASPEPEPPTPKIELDSKAAHWAQETENNPGAARWIAQTTERLRKFRPSADTPEVAVETTPTVARVLLKYDRAMQPRSGGWVRHGLVKFTEDDWVYAISLSSHSMFNVVLAVDADNHLYKTYGHVCPYLGLLLPEKGELESSRDFFRTTTVGDGGARFPWIKVNPGS